MANNITWSAAPTSRGTVLTTELNALANAGYSAAGSEYDNTTNLAEYAAAHIALASLNPTAGAYIALFIVQELAATYEDAPSSTNPGWGRAIWADSVATGSAAKNIATCWFRIPPGKMKFVLYNATNVQLGASGSTVTLYTANDTLP